MADVIQLLPDSVANQIAAGEVVQRPASVVKELIENAVDAGAAAISVYIQEGGRGSIRVIDNGCGLSPVDARRAFERHATSKISCADDLYALTTFGFRGEALASIASVSEVDLRTKRSSDEVGLHLHIDGGVFGESSAVNVADGTQITVKNLFYNVPARRKFLKSKSVETKHVVDEFQRVALCRPRIEMELYDNDTPRYRLPVSNLRQRIVGIFGKHINANLLDLGVDTTLVTIEGFVGAPHAAKKSGAGEQFFFVNNRYFRSPYLHRAVMEAYEKLIPPGMYPAYFLYLTVDPSRLDINIHPTKTEIKFEDEQALWQILNAAVRESLGKLGAVPLMDFDDHSPLEIPVFRPGSDVKEPKSALNPRFNPFSSNVPAGWETLYKDSYDTFDRSTSEGDSFRQLILDEEVDDNEMSDFISKGFETPAEEWAVQSALEIGNGLPAGFPFLRISDRYVALNQDNSLLIVDLRRAHHRVLYERFLHRETAQPAVNQQHLFPEPVSVSTEELRLLKDMQDDLLSLGFDMQFEDETVVFKGLPADIQEIPSAELVDSLLHDLHGEGITTGDQRRQTLALTMADVHALHHGKNLQQTEIEEIISTLFACREPAFTADGRAVWTTLSIDEIKKRMP